MKVVIKNFGENTSFWGAKGDEGLSAYEVALKNGFEGTEQQWLETFAPTFEYVQPNEDGILEI